MTHIATGTDIAVATTTITGGLLLTITRMTFTTPNQPYEKGRTEKDAINDGFLPI